MTPKTDNFFALTCLLVLLFLSLTATGQSLRVATYNVRYDNKSDTANAWNKRLPVLAGLIQFHDFDIVGTQEVLQHQVEDMQKQLPAYGHIGVGRDDGKAGGEFSGIFFKKDKFTLLQQGTFWLSPTPDKPSKGWDAALPRICTWGQFRDNASGRTFYFFNTHFDHQGEKARNESAKQLLSRIRQLPAGTPVILAGDFNFDQNSPNYQLLNDSKTLQDAYQQARVRFAPKGTFNGFKVSGTSDSRIDHIFLSKDMEVKRYGILTYLYGDGKLPSDHYPVMVELEMK
jgi:endonuclease/exonuclease/phosphatase family metal-dependent hydrolase